MSQVSLIDGHDDDVMQGDLISRSVLLEDIDAAAKNGMGYVVGQTLKRYVRKAPAVDAVEVEALEAWLYEIAMNNTGHPLCDACEEIISRLDGLRLFAKERRDGE